MNPFRDFQLLKHFDTLRWIVGVVCGVALLHGCAVHRPPERSEPPTPAERREEVHEVFAEKHAWVERTLGSLSLEEKVAQMVVPKAFASYAAESSDELQRLIRLVKERKVGGIAVFLGDVYETAMLTNALQQCADVPLLVSADYERGITMRTRRGTPFPEAMAVAAPRSAELAYSMGLAVADEARALGVHQNYAPVADVNCNPQNPVINVRSYGEDPQWVAEIAAAYASGLQDGGVVATAKHFPGHGDTGIDSHLGLPVLSFSKGRLDSVELVPFRALINGGVMSTMIGHLEVTSLEPSVGLPATLSRNVVTGLLRNELGFEGLVLTDAIDMQGLLNGFGVDEAAVRALEAGVDMLIVPPIGSEGDLMDAVVRAVRSGRISQQRIETSVRRILSLKESLKLHERRTVELDSIRTHVGTVEHWDLACSIARASITLLQNAGVLPINLSRTKKILNVVLCDMEDYRTEVHRSSTSVASERVGTYFTQQVRKRASNVETVLIDPRSNKLNFDSVLARAPKADLILCPVFAGARSGSGRLGLPQRIIDFANLLALQGKPVVFLTLGNPYVLGALKNGSAYLCAYSDCEPSTEAVVEAIFGEIPTTGRLPVTIPGMFALGSGIGLVPNTLREARPSETGFDAKKLARVDTVIDQAIRDSAFPGAQIAVVKDGFVVLNRSYGSLEYGPQSLRVNDSTLYDLASLTKVVATTAAVMKLYDEGKIRLGDRVVDYVPEFGARDKDSITIQNLLLHDSGLPAYKKLYLSCTTASEALDSVYQSELVYHTGDSTIYSDFGFIVLGKIVEKVSGLSLDEYVQRTFFSPLGMARTLFRPPASMWSNLSPTEVDTVWRKRLVRGTVHDETAELLGGVSGHAGLFSTASDLAVFMQMLVNGGKYGGRDYLKAETVRLFTRRSNPSSTRALGWDLKTTNGYSTAGSMFSQNSFGHTGFTGTSIWADPSRNLFVIFLTSRVHPTRVNSKISKVRPLVHDAVVSALVRRER
jgi:beta-glucosidase-like glycosyl hydrolase/CubicO group peptidase (beta-lactamase class C family)